MAVVEDVVGAAQAVIHGDQGCVDRFRDLSIDQIVTVIVDLAGQAEMLRRLGVRDTRRSAASLPTEDVVARCAQLNDGDAITDRISPAALVDAVLDLSQELSGLHNLLEIQRGREAPWLARWRDETRKFNLIPDYGEMLGWLFAKLDEYRAAERPRPVFRHYKGMDYVIMGYARHTETRELMVVYRSTLSRDGDTAWVRPSDMFFDSKTPDGRLRFAPLQGETTGAPRS